VIGDAEAQGIIMTSMMTELGPALVERVRVQYAEGKLTVDQIAADNDIGRSTVYELRKHEGWPLRRSAEAAPASDPTAPPVAAPAPIRVRPARGGDAGLRRQVERLHRFVADRLETILAGGEADPERIDRRAAFLARTMVQLDGLNAALRKRAAQEHRDGEAPRSINELRDELCRHLARLRTDARRGTLGPRPAGGGARNDADPLALSRPGGPAPADGPASA
jgi:hypothetical protein